jgi:ABC-type taurine transport system ATPase subunit
MGKMIKVLRRISGPKNRLLVAVPIEALVPWLEAMDQNAHMVRLAVEKILAGPFRQHLVLRHGVCGHR